MRAETIVKTIKRWSEHMGVPAPGIDVREDTVSPQYKGVYFRDRKLIRISGNGMNRETIKHEFLHYLHHLKGRSHYDSTHYFYATLKLSDFYHDRKLNEEHSVCKKVAMSWKNIKKWFDPNKL